ncbi:MAG TPA: zinc ribbon domain-containing protein [Anaerolineales bacterium]|nr:zinc ribbon domain-containing protein [Anaerolineales bacterium]
MPIYEFICLDCGKKFERFFSYSEYGKKTVVCVFCGSMKNKRKLTRVRVKQKGTDFSALTDPALLGQIDDNPKLLGKMMREIGSDMEGDLPLEFNEVIDRLESGQSPDEITNSLGDSNVDSDDGAVG